MVVGMKMDLSSSDVWTEKSTRFTNFELSVRIASFVRFIRQLELTSALDLSLNFQKIALLQVGVESLYSE